MLKKIGNLPDAAVLAARSQSLIARREIYEEIITADGAIFERKLDGGADSSIRWGHRSYVRHATDPVDAGSEPAGFNTASACRSCFLEQNNWATARRAVIVGLPSEFTVVSGPIP